MPELFEIQETGDILYTLPSIGEHRGMMRAWKIQADGTLVEVHPVTGRPGSLLHGARDQ